MKTIRTFEKVVLNRHGDPQELKVQNSTLTPDKNRGLLIEVWAVGVGFADIMAQRGGYLLAPGLPFSPGYDFVGRVANAYDSADFKEGELVAGLLPAMGTYQELLEAPADRLVKLPSGLSPLKAAASVLNYLTAYCMLDRKAQIKDQTSVLIHGASGGVGMALAQIGKIKGLRMYGTASSAKHPGVEAMGVFPIDYKDEDFVEVIRKKEPAGVDAAFDAIGGRNLVRSAHAVRRGGTVVSYGFSGTGYGGKWEAVKGTFQFLKLALAPNGKDVKACATPAETKKDPEWYRDVLKNIFELICARRLDPVIAGTFKLQEASKAHASMESGSCQGKILLTTRFYEG